MGKVRGTKEQPTDQGINAMIRDLSILTHEKRHRLSRPDSHETRISRVTRTVAGRVGSGQEDIKISRVGSGRVESGRVGSRRLEFFAGRFGSGRVGSRRLEILTGRYPFKTGTRWVKPLVRTNSVSRPSTHFSQYIPRRYPDLPMVGGTPVQFTLSSIYSALCWPRS